MKRKKLQYTLIYLVIAVVLCSVIFNSFKTAYYSHISFFEKEPNHNIQNFLNTTSNITPLYTFFKYTGLDTGYGFFSPNVASDFIVIHEIYKDGKKKNSLSDTRLKSKEGALRFANMNTIFMDYLETKQKEANGKKLTEIQNLNQKYLQTVLKRLSDQRMILEKADSITTKVFLYNFPPLKNYPTLTPKIIEIEKVYSNRNK